MHGLGASLSGVLVVDLSRQFPGPFCAQILRDLGARVVKVEDASGDFARWIDPQVDGMGYVFEATNRGKEDVAVNLRDPAGVEVVRRLAARADVLVESFRPGILARLGLAPDALLAANPKLVVASLTGFGQEGPLASAPGHDLNYQALAGLVSLADPPQPPAAQVADVGGALYATIAILAQLRTGRGAHLDLALADAALAQGLLALRRAAAGERTRAGESELWGGLPGYGVYRTADGKWISLGALEPKFWERFLEAACANHLAEHGLGLADETAREATAKVVAERTLDEWARLLAEHDVPWAPVLPPEEALRHPQFVRRAQDATPGAPLGLASRGRAPQLGEHSDAVLAELGYTGADVAELRRRRVVL